MNEKQKLYEEVEKLRKQVKNTPKCMKYYKHLKELNKGDMLYGWEFENDAILYDTLDDVDMYQESYARDILRTYKGELECIIYKCKF